MGENEPTEKDETEEIKAICIDAGGAQTVSCS